MGSWTGGSARDRPPSPCPRPAPRHDADVSAVADVHGCTLELDLRFQGAGLTNAGGDWIAPRHGARRDRRHHRPGTDPLVVLSGPLAAARCPAAGGHVALLEGTARRWRAPPRIRRRQAPGRRGSWSGATGRAQPVNPYSLASPRHRARAGAGPGRCSLAPYARWRDACFVHAGLVPGLDDLAGFAATSARLWRHGDFLWGPPFPDAPAWRAYREAGIGARRRRPQGRERPDAAA